MAINIPGTDIVFGGGGLIGPTTPFSAVNFFASTFGRKMKPGTVSVLSLGSSINQVLSDRGLPAFGFQGKGDVARKNRTFLNKIAASAGFPIFSRGDVEPFMPEADISKEAALESAINAIKNPVLEDPLQFQGKGRNNAFARNTNKLAEAQLSRKAIEQKLRKQHNLGGLLIGFKTEATARIVQEFESNFKARTVSARTEIPEPVESDIFELAKGGIEAITQPGGSGQLSPQDQFNKLFGTDTGVDVSNFSPEEIAKFEDAITAQANLVTEQQKLDALEGDNPQRIETEKDRDFFGKEFLLAAGGLGALGAGLTQLSNITGENLNLRSSQQQVRLPTPDFNLNFAGGAPQSQIPSGQVGLSSPSPFLGGVKQVEEEEGIIKKVQFVPKGFPVQGAGLLA